MGKHKMVARAIALSICTIGLSASVHAVVDTPAVIGSAVTTTDCPQLNQAITVGTSTKVVGAYVCRAADAVAGVLNRVGVGTCHPGGTAKARNVTCSKSGTVAGGDIAYFPTTCGIGNFAVDGAGEPGSVLPGTAGEGAISGLTMFSGTTTGGSIGELGMASTVCDSASLPGLVGSTFR